MDDEAPLRQTLVTRDIQWRQPFQRRFCATRFVPGDRTCGCRYWHVQECKWRRCTRAQQCLLTSAHTADATVMSCRNGSVDRGPVH